MNKILRLLVLVALVIVGRTPAFANHVFGADFYYEHISGTTYKVSLAIYGDCKSLFDNTTPAPPITSLPTARPIIQLRNGTTILQQISLDVENNGVGVEVTPVCPAQKSSTKCASPNGTIDGVLRYIYSGTINVTTVSSDLNFHFEGELGTSSAGRSNQITNIQNPGSSIMVLDAELNNVPGPNSSPRFTTIPTPFYCINVPQQYNQGAVDADNDSLGYQLAAPLEPNSTPVYVNGFFATYPLDAVTNTFSFNPLNGQLNFTPANTQKSLVVNKVNEYRNGVKVGSASRELTFVVLANCAANTPPSGTADTSLGVSLGTTMLNANSFNVCQGTPLVKFNIKPSDLDGDSINVQINGLPSGATANIVNNNTKSPTISFSWATTSVAPGVYNFFVTYKDQGCPISASQTQAYTINVIRPNTLTSRITAPTECAHKAKVEYTLAYGLLPRTIIVRQNSSILNIITDSSSIVTDSLAAGTYTITITSPNLTCPSVVTVVVKDSGIYPYPPIFPDTFYCLNDRAVALIATPVINGNVFWYDSLGTRLPGPPTPSTATAGIFRYMASQLVKVCESRQDTALVYVTKRPTADFVIDPSPVCARDTATVSFTGTIGVGPILDYKWNWGTVKPVSGDSVGPYRIIWYNPGTYAVTLRVFENKCPSDSITKQLRVKPKPSAAFTIPNTLCLYDTATVRYVAQDSLAGQAYAWDFDGATQAVSTDKGPFRLHWLGSGTKMVTLGVSLEGCTDTSSHTIVVHEAPQAGIVNVPETVCYGDKIFLKYVSTGTNNTYAWLPKDKIDHELDGSPTTRVYTAPTTYSLVATNEFSCSDTASITYTNVQPCCQFSYPNAFTPNNDTKNDKYRVVTYGNQEYFELSIFNRWGQRVFHSSDPYEGWDGTFNNKPCDMGVYNYMIKAKCLTGYEENKHGELTLVR